MTIDHELVNKSTVVLTLDGRLDTANASLLERKIKQWEIEITELILDFSKLDYISSMGLRVLLRAKKELQQEGRKLEIRNMNDSIKEVFEMTGFLNLMVQDEKFVVIRKKEPMAHGTDAIVLSLNGQMQSEHIEMITKELSEIKEANQQKNKTTTVILDMEKLTRIDSGVGLLLKQAFDDTTWEGRQLCFRNLSVDIQAALKQDGLENI
jgi:anti-sigma B factor antagonist